MHPDHHFLDRFTQSLHGRNEKTIKAYRSALQKFLAWLSQQPGGSSFIPERVTETAVKSYLNYLKGRSLSANTRSQSLTVVRQFCRWLISEGELDRDPTTYIVRPAVVNTAPRELTESQRYVLKNLVEMSQSLRQSAIFALGYWAGMRVSEIAELKLADCDINQRSGQIFIRDSKDEKSRTIDLHNEVRRAVYRYLFEDDRVSREMRDSESGYLFTSQRAAWLRTLDRPDHLSVRGIEHIWTQLKVSARKDEHDLIHDIKFHDLRHDFAHRAREAGWNLEEIAVYLGHQTKDGRPAIGTTVRYTLPSRKQLKKKLQELDG